ncbi:MAG: hypothetical protein KBI41_04275 [Kiritimatiellae bacterium]|nr:hypothetical protein [Kiritimatiellia bacterium]
MEEAVDLTGDLGEFRARVGIAFQDDVEEKVGVHQPLVDVRLGEEDALAGKVVVGELEEQVDGSPLFQKSLAAGAEFAVWIERF